MFCCEFTSYFKFENVFNFQLQPLDLILSLSARWDCVPFLFGIFATCKCPPPCSDPVPTQPSS